MTSLYPPLSPEEIAQRLETIAQEDWGKPLLNTKPNFWRIIEYGKNSYEIRQSRMIGWLLDTHQNHGIGDIFVKELIKIYAEDTTQLSNAQEFLFEKNFSTEVEFEVAITNSRDKKGRLDIQVVDSHNKLLIAIENKMYSSEHNAGKSDASQLQVYKEFFDKKIKNPESGYEGYTPLYIYLAPAGSETKTEAYS